MNAPRLLQTLGALAILTVGMVAAGFSLRAQEAPPPAAHDNPLVGDWVTLKITGKAGGTVIFKQTLIAKDDTTATIKNEPTVKSDFSGAEKVLPVQEIKVLLSQLRDPTKLAAKLEKGKIEKIQGGKEALDVKGSKIACDWMEFKITFEAGGKSYESNSKIWTSPQIPLEGLVKLVSETSGRLSSMELLDYGRMK